MDELIVSTVVHESPGVVYEFLLDFPGYVNYSNYLDRVTTLDGDGGPGTRYALQFSWWKLSYTAHSEVTEVDPPRSIDWRLVEDIDAHGRWLIEPDETDAETGGTVDTCRVSLEVYFDPDSASSSALDLPRFVSMNWVLGKTIPLVKSEAERVVERAVASVEGEERPVELDVFVDSDRL